MQTKYKLYAQAADHTSDVRGCCFNPISNQIITGSRDRTAKVWLLSSDISKDSPLTLQFTLFEHEHWVNTIVMLPGNKSFATGCHDSNIRIFDFNNIPSDSPVFKQSLGGHRSSVSSLSTIPLSQGTATTDEFLLVSGSWDGTARVWDLNKNSCVAVLPDHENSVCVLGLPNGLLVTGSAGVQTVNNTVEGYQLRMWDIKSILSGKSSSSPIKKMSTQHTGSIRSLCLLPSGNGFASASNDGTIIVWSLDGEMINKMQNPSGFEGLPAFNFCVAPIEIPSQDSSSNGNQKIDALLCASNDCCLRVWNASNGSLLQEIGHPSTVWCACAASNGDIVTGSSDGAVRVFTQDDNRAASETEQLIYEESVVTAVNAIKNKQSGGGNSQVDPSKLENIETAKPGKSDGQVKMFNRQGIAWVYQWMDVSKTWVEVGQVMGGDENGGKEEIDGVFYDKVLPVEIEDTIHGTGIRKLKLGFNNEDNPYQVATSFVEKYDVPKDYIPQIAQYITTNRASSGLPTIAAVGDVSKSSAMDVDKPKQQSSKRFKNFPLHDSRGLCFDKLEKADIGNIQAKITEFNAKTKVALDQNQQKLLAEVFGILQNTSRYHASTFSKPQMDTLYFLLTKWEDELIFPVLDLVRALLIHPDSTPNFMIRFKKDIVQLIQARVCASGASMPNQLLGTRILVNMFRYDAAAEIVMLKDALDLVKLSDCLAANGNKNVRAAFVTLLLNLVNYQYFKGKFDDLTQISVRSAISVINNEVSTAQADVSKHSSDALFRSFLVIGIAGLASRSEISKIKSQELASTMEKVKSNMGAIAPKGSKTEEVVQELSVLLS